MLAGKTNENFTIGVAQDTGDNEFLDLADPKRRCGSRDSEDAETVGSMGPKKSLNYRLRLIFFHLEIALNGIFKDRMDTRVAESGPDLVDERVGKMLRKGLI